MRFFRFYRVGTLSGFRSPLYIHASVYIVASLIALSAFKAPLMAAVTLASYVGVILVHEIGHALVARRLGLSVYRIDIGWFHGCCHYESSQFEWHEVLVSWGGVLAQLAVAVVVLSVGATGALDSWQLFGPVLIFLGYINVFIAIFNSIPAPGLDGAIMWRIVPIWIAQRAHKQKKKRVNKSLRVVPKDE